MNIVKLNLPRIQTVQVTAKLNAKESAILTGGTVERSIVQCRPVLKVYTVKIQMRFRGIYLQVKMQPLLVI